MDPQIADIFEAAVYSAGAVGVAYTIARHWYQYQYQKRKSDNETHPARMQAVKELIGSEGFKNYLQQRTDLTKTMLEDKEITNTAYIEDIVNTSLGEFNPEQFR